MLEKQRTLFKIKYHVQFKLLYMMLYIEKQLYIHKKHNTTSHGFFKYNDKYWIFSIITFFMVSWMWAQTTNLRLSIEQLSFMDECPIQPKYVSTPSTLQKTFFYLSPFFPTTQINLIMGRTKYTRISIEMIEWG
jgi:hypothetical protein